MTEQKMTEGEGSNLIEGVELSETSPKPRLPSVFSKTFLQRYTRTPDGGWLGREIIHSKDSPVAQMLEKELADQTAENTVFLPSDR